MRLATVAVLAFVVVFATAAVLGSAADGNRREAAAAAHVPQINVTATLTSATVTPVGPTGRRGDRQLQRWRITDRFGRTIGRMYASCLWVVVRARLCTVELQMPQGKIAAIGSSQTVFEGEFAVAGGTGRYRGTGGVMVFSAIGLRKQILRVEIST